VLPLLSLEYTTEFIPPEMELVFEETWDT